MQNLVQLPRDMDEVRHIIVVELKAGIAEKVLNIFQGAGGEVVHANNRKAFG
jgi:hypothetical protein